MMDAEKNGGQNVRTASIPGTTRTNTPMDSGSHDHDGEILGAYFTGPRDLDHHSKWPLPFQLHGSVMPLMIFPLLFVAIWATAITCISHFVYDIGINHVLLTVLGFVVALSLSFRSSTAYERYIEGRKYWAQLSVTTQSMARLIWVHAEERPEFAKDDLINKVAFCNLLVAFAHALKHRLRFEPFTHYEDLHPRIKHLAIVAQQAEVREWKQPSVWKVAGRLLGLPMAESNPRKLIKECKQPLGNVPVEILSYCSTYVRTIISDGTFKSPAYHTQAMTCLTQMNDILVGTERVLSTPLPIAYSIVIAQISWAYILLLPFQLWDTLNWVTIPATILAAYIILGIPLAGREIENPFGDGVNDLPLDSYCDQIRHDVDLIMSRAPGVVQDWVQKDENALLYPLGMHGYNQLNSRSIEEIRDMLRSKPGMGKNNEN